MFRGAVAEVGLQPDLMDDCILMASELAANTLHARAVAGPGGEGDWLVSVAPDMGGEPISSAGPVPPAPQITPAPLAPQITQTPPAPQAGCPELWLYLRGLGIRRELVCKVFDCSRGWRHGSAPLVSRTSAQALAGRGLAPVHEVAGRGLQLVHELSGGRWGHHPTRARLGGWGVRGKAVWFAVPAPLAHARLVDVTGLHAYTLSADVTAARANERLSARQAATQLQSMLAERGFGGRVVRGDQPASDMSLLSVRPGLTVWCRSGVVSLTTPEGPRGRWSYADLVEAAEQTVRRFEELELSLDLAAAEA